MPNIIEQFEQAAKAHAIANAGSKQAYKRSLKAEAKLQKAEYDNIVAIQKTATRAARDAAKARVSRRILMAKQSEALPIVCPATGIVSLLAIPAIPNNFLEWDSPFQSLDICRQLVQRGRPYLLSLDTQILAGLLITLTADYDLIYYGAGMHSAEKNAILRTVGKDAIIKALLLIEDYVHNKNLIYIPRLSLAWDSGLAEHERSIEGRLINWLKLIVEYVVKPEPVEAEHKEYQKTQFLAPKKTMKALTVAKAKGTLLAELKADCKLAKTLIAKLPFESVNSKIRTILKGIFEGKNIVSMDSTVLKLLIGKLEIVATPEALKLASIMGKDYRILQDEGINEFDSPSMPVLPSKIEAPKMEASKESTFKASSILEKIKAKKLEQQKAQALQPVQPIVQILQPAYNPAKEQKIESAYFKSIKAAMEVDKANAAVAYTGQAYDADSLPDWFCAVSYPSEGL